MPHPQLFDTGPMPYLSPQGPLVWRPWRTWITDEGQALCIVSEPADAEGMSVTNAADIVMDVVTRTYPDRAVRLFEHYPADSISPERYAEILATPQGITFKHISTEDLRNLIGPTLDATNPLKEA